MDVDVGIPPVAPCIYHCCVTIISSILPKLTLQVQIKWLTIACTYIYLSNLISCNVQQLFISCTCGFTFALILLLIFSHCSAKIFTAVVMANLFLYHSCHSSVISVAEQTCLKWAGSICQYNQVSSSSDMMSGCKCRQEAFNHSLKLVTCKMVALRSWIFTAIWKPSVVKRHWAARIRF